MKEKSNKGKKEDYVVITYKAWCVVDDGVEAWAYGVPIRRREKRELLGGYGEACRVSDVERRVAELERIVTDKGAKKYYDVRVYHRDDDCPDDVKEHFELFDKYPPKWL